MPDDGVRYLREAVTQGVILLHPDLSRPAKLLYGILRRYAREKGFCYPSCVRLAKDMGRSERTVRRAMDELVAAGIVTRWRRGLMKTTVTYLISPGESFPVLPDRPSVSDQDRPLVTDRIDGKENKEERESHSKSSTAAENRVVEEDHSAGTASLPQQKRPPQDLDRDRIRLLIADITRQLNDRAPLWSTTSRLLAVMHRAEVAFPQFADAIYEARTRTLRRANIRDRNERGVCRMGYFCSTLEDILGVRQQEIGGTRLTTDEDREVFGLAEAPHGDDNPPTLAADEPEVSDARPSQSWPIELLEMGIADLPSYIRICRRGRFDDDAETIAYAQQRLQRYR